MTQPKHAQIGLPSHLYRPLDDAGVRRIAEAALHILEASGVAVYSATAREAFRSAGATVDEDTQVVTCREAWWRARSRRTRRR